MSNSPPSIKQAIHISRGNIALPRRAKALSLRDSLEQGPSHIDATLHLKARREYWSRSYEQVELLAGDKPSLKVDRKFKQSIENDIIDVTEVFDRVGQFSSGLPIVVWTTSAWLDRLQLFWLLAGVKKLSIDINRFWIAEPFVPEHDDSQISLPIGAVSEAKLMESLVFAKSLSESYRDESSKLWSAFAGPDPRKFCKLRERGLESFPHLKTETEPYRYGFPRRTSDGRLRMSEPDELLLSAIHEGGCIRPVDVIKNKLIDSPLFSVYHEHFVGFRLHQWHEHTSRGSVLISEPREGANSLTRIAYRLTDRGVKLLAEGLDSLPDAPAMDVGGVRAYGEPWVVEETEGDWNICEL